MWEVSIIQTLESYEAPPLALAVGTKRFLDSNKL